MTPKIPAASVSSAAPHAHLARAFFQSQDQRRGGPAPELCDPTYRAELGGYPPMPWTDHQAFGAAFYAGIPDLHHEVARVFASDDAVAVRFVLLGTHTGTLFGIPATGRPVRIVANVLLTVLAGRVTHLQGVFDEAGMLRQLGVLLE